MNTIDDIDAGARLRAGDPLRDDPAMLPADVEAMRRTVLAATGRAAQSPAWWPPLLAFAATAAALVVAVVGVRMRESRQAVRAGTTVTTAATPSDSSSSAAGGRRQLQFATPGGTRVIWVFDPEFNP